LAREDGWRAFRVAGVLDFSLTGVLSGITGVLAGAGVGVFAVSTYDTDYILVKRVDAGKAADALARAGYEIRA
ncbi:MAG: ACT domain-containing protein, partial [Clostridia bacterium]|nr:ACT domain-containing protein [Clostridia bacterium]